MKVIHIDFPHWLTTINGRFLGTIAQLKLLWTVWNLRGFILFSLALQAILILFAPFRKQSANLSVIISIWLAYLLADYIATQAVGLIPNYNEKYSHHNTTAKHVSLPHADLLAFWSPFLLVHLGGPDTITALALEDNELWMRTGLHLCTQVSATGRVFFQSLPTSILWFPTVLMFVAGILKYSERMLSLYHARLTKFKSSLLKEPDPGPNYSKLMESYESYLDSKLPAKFDTNLEPDQYRVRVPHRLTGDEAQTGDNADTNPDDPHDPDTNLDAINSGSGSKISWESITRCLETVFRRNKLDRKKLSNVHTVRKAYEYFEKYKGLYVDMIFSFRDRSESREEFLKLNSKDAFKLIETELNFTYEVFFTKMIVIHRKFGTVIRCISCSCEVLSLVIWSFFISKKPEFHDRDIQITYILLVGAIVLDVIAILRVLLSDWSVAMLNKESEVRAYLYDKMLSVRERTWGSYWDKKDCPWGPYLRRVFFRRWSESVLQFNLITYCVDPWSRWARILFVILPIQDKFDELAYVSKRWFANDLRNFIFDEIMYKAEIAEDPTDAADVCKSTGDWVLRSLAGLDFNPFEFFPWTTVEYDQCLLLWHVATELLYQEDKDMNPEENSTGGRPPTDGPSKENFLKRLLGCTPRFCRPRADAKEKKGETTEKDLEEDTSKTTTAADCDPSKKADFFDRLLGPSKENFLKRLLGCIPGCRPRVDAKEEKAEPTEKDYRKYSKTLSDYMMYLLTQQPEMMLAVSGISEVRFRDTCAEAMKFFDRVLPKSNKKPRSPKEACGRIMKVRTDINPRDIKGDRSKSVLFDACRLAKKLKELKSEKVGSWELIAKVWVELVSYSATHCRANSHAAQLRQGGELLTLMWLLMVHLGLGTQYRITQGNARSKLIINK